jgi:hypothetical protein
MLSSPPPSAGEYRVISDNEPRVDAILWTNNPGRAWIQIQDRRYHVAAGMRVDDEWRVEDVRRGSVLFKRQSTRTFVEIPLITREKPRFQKDWSFWGNPLSLWDALECVAQGFRLNAVMHAASTGTITPRFHTHLAEKLLVKITPPHHRFFQAGPSVVMLPIVVNGETWGKILERMKNFRSDFLMLRFPGMAGLGSLLSRGDDIQQVLRRISLGSGTLIKFPRDLRFPVYAVFSHTPFHQILTKIVFANQCVVVERTGYLEVLPFSSDAVLKTLLGGMEAIITGPLDIPDGIGENPPPLEPAPIPYHSPPTPIP